MAACDPNETTYTVAELIALKRARMKGIKEVRYADKTVVYQSLSEMKNLIDEMELDIYGCGTSKGRRVYAITSKGLC